MRIQDNNEKKATCVKAVAAGQCFYRISPNIERDLYIKIISNGGLNAANLRTGCIYCLGPDDLVEEVDAHVVVGSK